MGLAQKRLKKARSVRHKQAQKMKLISTGQLSLTNVLGDPPDALRSVRVYNILCAAPHMGEVGARKCCESAGVWPLQRLSLLTRGERHRLIDALPPRAKGG